MKVGDGIEKENIDKGREGREIEGIEQEEKENVVEGRSRLEKEEKENVNEERRRQREGREGEC